MLFVRWQHHLRFCSGFSYAPLKAMVTKISKWSRIQDFFRITPKIETLVVYAMPDILAKFQKDPFITFWVILLTDRQTERQTNKIWQKHYLLGGGKNKYNTVYCSFHAYIQNVFNTSNTKDYINETKNNSQNTLLHTCSIWRYRHYRLLRFLQRKIS